ncbi:MAG: pyridoxamine 5'-phosphate oxidase [Flavobacteriales bacterium]|nr:pyridoxamine 5'-phosphate oxidase [Flavobacteriales bacterium]
MKKIENLRTDYKLKQLNKSSLESCPIEQFKLWFSEVLDVIVEPTAMVLSTYSQNKGVSSRVVLLKDLKKDGFIFYTNYNSLKSEQIKVNPYVSLLFFWPDFQRQIRINGLVKKISHQSSVNYFKKRPRESQISAWASSQSSVIENRFMLESLFHDFEKKFQNKTILKPPYWGGYKVIPNSIEFWQGRESRMHDRFLYEKNKNNQWVINRLCP